MTKTGSVFVFSVFAAALNAQTVREVAPLKNWATPLFWQPNTNESREVAQKSGLEPRADQPAGALVFVAMTPCRLVDTRTTSAFSGQWGPPSLSADVTRTFPIYNNPYCTVPSIAGAYSLNVTVVPPVGGSVGFLTIWPYGVPQPNTSTLNDQVVTENGANPVLANAAIVPAGSDPEGSVDVYASNATNLLIDINGYFAPETGITLTQGSAGAPSLSFANDPTTGIFSSGAGDVNIATGGSTAITVAPGGKVGIGTATPGYALDVAGDINFSGSARFQGSPVLRVSAGTGAQNLATGIGALSANTTGTSNTATGFNALLSNTTGSNNTAAGDGALTYNTTGAANTATGLNALASNTTGSNNTAAGDGALTYNTTGYDNTAVGLNALSSNISGAHNIAIGYGAADSVSSSGSYNIHIGSGGATGDNGTIRIGTPGAQTSFYVAGVNGVTTTNSAVPVLIDTTNGQLGVSSSSRRYKEDIQDMGEASRGLMQLRPVTFRYQKPFADGSKPLQYGLIAEEVAEIYPDLVAYSADGQIETVKYQVLDSMLLNEVQRQQAEIEAQRNQMQDLQNQISELKRLVDSLSGQRSN
jgi:hypothetical protein